MVYDVGWGADVPLLDSTSGDTILPVGFVHLPLSGGYLYVTLQIVKGVPHVVVTRFNANGSLNTHWKDPASDPYVVLGSAVLALPVPDLDANNTPLARVVVNIEGPSERIYFAELFGGGSMLRISRFDVSLTNFETSAISASLSGGFGSIEAMTAGALVGSLGTGAVVAVQGTGTNAIVSQLYGAAGSSLAITGVGSHSSPGFRINDMTARLDRAVDVVGSEGAQALYLQMRTQSPTSTIYETYFNLNCPNGSPATASALDGLVPAPPGDTGDDTMVLGRADCGSAGRVSMIERVSNIDFLGSAHITGYSPAGTSVNCSDGFASAPCRASYLTAAGDAANSLVATSPDAFLAHISGNSGAATFLGDEANAALSGYPLIVPASSTGASLEYPYLIGASLNSAQMPGIRRIAIDRVFADGAGG